MTAWAYLYLFSFLDHQNSAKIHRGSTPWFRLPYVFFFFRAKGRCSSNLHILCLLCSETIPGDSRKTLPETDSSSHPENRPFAQKKTIVVFQTSILQVRCYVTFREGNPLICCIKYTCNIDFWIWTLWFPVAHDYISTWTCKSVYVYLCVCRYPLHQCLYQSSIRACIFICKRCTAVSFDHCGSLWTACQMSSRYLHERYTLWEGHLTILLQRSNNFGLPQIRWFWFILLMNELLPALRTTKSPYAVLYIPDAEIQPNA